MLKKNLEQTGQTAQRMGDDVKDAGRKSQEGGEGVKQYGEGAQRADRMTRGLGRAVNYLKGALLGLIGIRGLWAFFQKWLDYTKDIAQAKRDLANATRDVNQAVKSLVSQADLMGSDKAQKAAKEQIKEIQKRGRLEDWGMASAVAVSAHSAFGSTG